MTDVIKQIHIPYTNWFFYSKYQIFDIFSKLPGAIYHQGDKEDGYCYVPGNRKDKVLLIAHVDTVWDYICSQQVEIELIDNRYYRSTNKYLGIGADDRVGVMTLWALRNLGHSLLLVDGEEIGCIASSKLMHSYFMRKEIKKHQFAIQFDRAGHKEIVFYKVGTKKFKKYVKKQTNFNIERGTFTDIVKICKDICGVNISVAYYNEHTPAEYFDRFEWLEMLKVVTKWLRNDNLPRFKNYIKPNFKLKSYKNIVENEKRLYYHHNMMDNYFNVSKE